MNAVPADHLCHRDGVNLMLRWAILFLIIAVIAAGFGFGGIAADAAYFAKILFFVFIILCALSLILGWRGSPPA